MVPSWRAVLATVVLVGAAGVLGLAVAYARTAIPEPKAVSSAQTSIVYYSDGKSELGRFAQVNRQIVAASAMSQNIRDAVVAAEDRSFYTNRGISATGIARAAWNNVRGKPLQGGSTITQQYVKNSYLESDRTWQRKAEEFLVSIKIARSQDKDAILTNYLNTIYFGRNAYGIEAAARAYFGVPAAELTVSQSAFLAGIIQGPELYDPNDGAQQRARAQERWSYVLDGMVEMGTLTAAEAGTLTFPEVTTPKARNGNAGQAGYLLTMVRQEVKAKAGYSDSEIDTGGLRIVSTFEKKKIEAGMAAVRDSLPEKVPTGVQVAMASVDPATGAVRSIFGGYDYLKRQRNAATQDIAQAGSTFKPFTLAAALEGRSGDGSDGISLRSRFDGSSPQRFPGYDRPVRNFGNTSFGSIDLVRATANSVNTVYLHVNEDIGPQRTMAAAVRAGVPQDATDLGENMSNVLGVASVHPIDMASAYATFAAGGIHHDRYVVQRIIEPNGGRVYEASVTGERVFDERVVADVNYALQQVVRSGTGTYARQLGRPVAAKTGTSQESRSAWFAGYTPQLATVVAMYRVSEDGRGALELPGFGGFSTITGGSFPVRIWTAYMSDALAGSKELSFAPRAGVGEVVNPEPTVTQTPTREATPTAGPTPPVPSQPTGTASVRPSDSTTDEPDPDPSGQASGRPTPAPSDRPTRAAPSGRPTASP